MKFFRIALALGLAAFVMGCSGGDVSDDQAAKTAAEIKKGNEAGMEGKTLPPGDGPGN